MWGPCSSSSKQQNLAALFWLMEYVQSVPPRRPREATEQSWESECWISLENPRLGEASLQGELLLCVNQPERAERANTADRSWRSGESFGSRHGDEFAVCPAGFQSVIQGFLSLLFPFHLKHKCTSFTTVYFNYATWFYFLQRGCSKEIVSSLRREYKP